MMSSVFSCVCLCVNCSHCWEDIASQWVKASLLYSRLHRSHADLLWQLAETGNIFMSFFASPSLSLPGQPACFSLMSHMVWSLDWHFVFPIWFTWMCSWLCTWVKFPHWNLFPGIEYRTLLCKQYFLKATRSWVCFCCSSDRFLSARSWLCGLSKLLIKMPNMPGKEPHIIMLGITLQLNTYDWQIVISKNIYGGVSCFGNWRQNF